MYAAVEVEARTNFYNCRHIRKRGANGVSATGAEEPYTDLTTRRTDRCNAPAESSAQTGTTKCARIL